MFVAASTTCYPELSYHDVLERLANLEFTAVELAVHEHGGTLKPSEVHADLDRAIDLCRATQRLTPAALSVDVDGEGDEYYEQFASCCRLAKTVKIVPIVVRASELGTPFLPAQLRSVSKSGTTRAERNL